MGWIAITNAYAISINIACKCSKLSFYVNKYIFILQGNFSSNLFLFDFAENCKYFTEIYLLNNVEDILTIKFWYSAAHILIMTPNVTLTKFL